MTMSDDESHEHPDEVEELVSKLRANDKAVKRLYLSFEKWEDLKPWSNADHRSQVDADVERLFNALEDNHVVRQVEIGSGCYFDAISLVGANAIARGLSKNQSVEDVVIYCEVVRGQSEMKTVLEGLMGNNSIKKLTIAGHGGDDDETPDAVLGRSLSRTLAKILRKSSSIEELSLVDESINWEEGLNPICDGLRKNKSIKTLDLVNGHFHSDLSWELQNCLHPGMLSKLCDAIGDKAKVRLKTHVCPSLNSLITNHQNIGELRAVFQEEMDIDEWRDLAKALSRNGSIKTVQFFNDDKSRQTPETIDWRSRSVLEAIASGSVESLVIKGMPLNDGGVDVVCRAMRQSTSIRHLKLDSCGAEKRGAWWEGSPEYIGDARITDQSAISIANLLRSSGSLESVQLDSLSGMYKYSIGDKGAFAIVKAVAERKVKTKHLTLTNCNISDEGGIAFSHLLRLPSSRLEELSLEGNAFSLSVLKRFADCLSENATLRSLELDRRNEDITRSQTVDMHIQFIKALKTNHSLLTLRIPCNNINMSRKEKGRVVGALRDMLQVNHTVSPWAFLEYNILGEVLLSANKEHPVLASTTKSVPFPSYMIDDMPVSLVPDAIERADDVAGVDGVFSLLRRVGDGIWDGVVPPETTEKKKKKRRKQ